MNLQRYKKDGLELIIDINTGEVFASQNAIARMCQVSKEAIRKWKGVNQIPAITAEIFTSGGLQGVNLFDEDAIYEALAKYNPNVLAKCAKAGLRIFLHGIAGYKYEVVEEHKIPQTYLEALKALVASEEKKLKLKQENALLEEENKQLSEAVDELFEYSSIMRVAKYNQCSEKAFSWRKLKAASIVLDLEIKKVPCPRFEVKNLYHHNAWRYVYPQYQLPETTTLRIS